MIEIRLGDFHVLTEAELLTPEFHLVFEPADTSEQQFRQTVAVVLPIGLARQLSQELSDAIQELG